MPRSLHDLRSLVHVALALAAGYAAVSGRWWGDVWLWAPISLLVGVHVLAVQHNHAHVPLFHGRWRNLAVDLATGLVTGFPMPAWRLHHLGGHHLDAWGADDPSSPFGLRGHEELDLRAYQRAYGPLFVAWSVDRAFRARGRRHRVELVLLAGVALVAFAQVAHAHGPWRLAFVPVQWTASGLVLGALNYYQHWRTGTAAGTHAGWTFTSRPFNALNYELGYHELHHRHPELHWSRLRVVHEADPSYAPADLVEHGCYPGYLLPARARRWREEHGRQAADVRGHAALPRRRGPSDVAASP